MEKGNSTIIKIMLTLIITLFSGIFVFKVINDSYAKKSEKLNLSIVNSDTGADDDKTLNLGSSFIRKLEQDSTLDVDSTDSKTQELGLKSGKYDIGLIIPSDFTETSVDVNKLNSKNEIKYLYKDKVGNVEIKEYNYQVEKLDKAFNSNIVEVYLRNVAKDVMGAQKVVKKRRDEAAKISKKTSENAAGLEEGRKNNKQIEANLKSNLSFFKDIAKTSEGFLENANKINEVSKNLIKYTGDLKGINETNVKEIKGFENKLETLNEDAKKSKEKVVKPWDKDNDNLKKSYENFNKIIGNNDGESASSSENKDVTLLSLFEDTEKSTQSLREFDLTGGNDSKLAGKQIHVKKSSSNNNENENNSAINIATAISKPDVEVENDGLSTAILSDTYGGSSDSKIYYDKQSTDVFNKYLTVSNNSTVNSTEAKMNLYRIKKICVQLKPIEDEAVDKLCGFITKHPASSNGGVEVNFDYINTAGSYKKKLILADNYTKDVMGKTLSSMSKGTISNENIVEMISKNKVTQFKDDYHKNNKEVINDHENNLKKAIQKNALYADDMVTLQSANKSLDNYFGEKGKGKELFDELIKADSDNKGKLKKLTGSSEDVFKLIGDEKTGWLSTFASNLVNANKVTASSGKIDDGLKEVKGKQSDLDKDLKSSSNDLKGHSKSSAEQAKAASSENSVISKIVTDVNKNIVVMNTNSKSFDKYVKTEAKFVKNFGTVMKSAKNGNTYNDQFFDYAKNPVLFKYSDKIDEYGMIYPVVLTLLISFTSLLCVVLNRNNKPKLVQSLSETDEYFERRVDNQRLNNLLIVSGVQSFIVTLISYFAFNVAGSNFFAWYVVIAISSILITLLIDLLLFKLKTTGLVVLALLSIFYLYANNMMLLVSNSSITSTIAKVTPFGIIESLLRNVLFNSGNVFMIIVLVVVSVLVGIGLYLFNTMKIKKGVIFNE